MLQLVRKHVGVRRDYESIYSLGVAFAAFAAAESVHGSGFLAAFAAGLTISALDVELCDCFLEYGETTAEMALMFAFVLFGHSLIWTGLAIIRPETLLFTLGVFCARPAAFIPALLPTNLRWKDRLLIAWFGPRALSSLLLVLLPVIAGVPGSESLVPICCLVVLFSVVLHGLSPNLLCRNPQVREIPTLPMPGPKLLVPEEGTASGDLVRIDSDVPEGEYISISEVKDLQSRSQPPLIIDARSDRTYDDRTEEIPGAIRLHPDRAVQMARDRGIPKTAVLAVLCA
jgi:NhaP-type Na+/H+ and K+/H+ antiporter